MRGINPSATTGRQWLRPLPYPLKDSRTKSYAPPGLCSLVPEYPGLTPISANLRLALVLILDCNGGHGSGRTSARRELERTGFAVSERLGGARVGNRGCGTTARFWRRG